MELTCTIPRKKPYKKVYQFKIVLLDTKPPVWRRILVSESYTFYDLHVAIQNAMGWTDSHLHCFEKRTSRIRYGDFEVRIDCVYVTEEYGQEENIVYDTETPITDYFKKEDDKLFYTYDFGNNWEHEIQLEAILTRDPEQVYPICLIGKLACPLEDCGSIPGYYDCIRAIKYRKNKELLAWVGDWNPYHFDPQEVDFENPRHRFLESWE